MNTEEFLRRQIIPLAYRQLPASELVTRARADDPEAFIALVCVKHSFVASICRDAVGQNGPVEDLAQETFVQLWRQRHKIRDPEAIESWLAQTARNLANKFVAAQTRGQAAGREWFRRGGEGVELRIPDRAAIEEELVGRVRKAISEQSDDDQRILWVNQHTGGDAHAAELLGLAVPTYRVRLHRARQKLRSLLRKYGVAPILGGVAFLGSIGSKAVSAVTGLWARTAGKALLIGLTLCGAAAVTGWVLTRDWNRTDEPAHVPPIEVAQPAVPVEIESLEDRNLRIVKNDLVTKIRDITQRFYPSDNQLKLVAVRAFGSEVEIELETSYPPQSAAQATRLRGRYCTWRRRLVVHGQPASQDRWYRMQPKKPAVFELPLPLIGLTEIVLGRNEYVEVERLFDQLPRDQRAESEHLRYLFGEPNGPLRLPAGGTGFCASGGRMFLVNGDMEMYVREPDGRWHYDSECPGWWLVAHDGQLYCTRNDEILTRPIDAIGKPWTLWKKFPVFEEGERGGFLAISGGRFYLSIHPGVLCYCPLSDPATAWVRENRVTPLWPDGLAGSADTFFGHNARQILSRPTLDATAAWTPVARRPEEATFLAVDGDQILAYGRPGPIYARPLNAGLEVDWKIVGQAHEPSRR